MMTMSAFTHELSTKPICYGGRADSPYISFSLSLSRLESVGEKICVTDGGAIASNQKSLIA